MNQSQSLVHQMFSSPVAQHHLSRELTVLENKSFNEVLKKVIPNQGNIRSHDDDVLEHKGLEGIKIFLEESVNKFVTDIYRPKNNVEFYITQSWLNINKSNMFHHKHYHPNSYLSGVLYLSCTDNDVIQFHNIINSSVLLDLFESKEEDANVFNSGLFSFPIKELDLMIFPSYLEHSVPTNNTNQKRVSLSFNTFVRGEIGSKSSLSQVVLH